MGAVDFYTTAAGKTVDDAYNNAVEHARYMHGHGGYTGTIAEKRGYVIFDVPPRALKTVINGVRQFYVQYAGSVDDPVMKEVWPKGFPAKYKPLVRRMYAVYDDKWGPACAVELRGKMAEQTERRRGEKVFAFFGFASC